MRNYKTLTKEEKKEIRKGCRKRWKEAPWFAFCIEKMKDLSGTRRYFKKLPAHVRFGRWEEVAMFPVYKGNLAKLIDFDWIDVMWKDKYDTPRYEYPPRIQLTLFWRWTLIIWWGFSNKDWEEWDNDRYWEQYLWTKHYCGNDIEKAKETWPWCGPNNESTWEDKYLNSKTLLDTVWNVGGNDAEV